MSYTMARRTPPGIQTREDQLINMAISSEMRRGTQDDPSQEDAFPFTHILYIQ